MSRPLYILLAIFHGVMFTLNIVTAIYLAPIINTPEGWGTGQLTESALYGLLMSIGTIVSAAITLGVYPDEVFDNVLPVVAIHSGLLMGMAFAMWYYVPLIY
jgi:hypothetical protein